jgi:hypothetical protein
MVGPAINMLYYYFNKVLLFDMESIAGSFENDRIIFGYVTSCPLIRQLENKKREPDWVFIFQWHHMSRKDFVVSPPGCGRSVTDFWGWDAREAQLRYPDEVVSDIWVWSTRRDLKPKFY